MRFTGCKILRPHLPWHDEGDGYPGPVRPRDRLRSWHGCPRIIPPRRFSACLAKVGTSFPTRTCATQNTSLKRLANPHVMAACTRPQALRSPRHPEALARPRLRRREPRRATAVAMPHRSEPQFRAVILRGPRMTAQAASTRRVMRGHLRMTERGGDPSIAKCATGPRSCATARRCGLGSSGRRFPKAPAAACRCAAN